MTTPVASDLSRLETGIADAVLAYFHAVGSAPMAVGQAVDHFEDVANTLVEHLASTIVSAAIVSDAGPLEFASVASCLELRLRRSLEARARGVSPQLLVNGRIVTGGGRA